MEKQNNSGRIITILLVILLVAIIGAVIFFALTINHTINSALSPVQNVNKAISTQVSKLSVRFNLWHD